MNIALFTPASVCPPLAGQKGFEHEYGTGEDAMSCTAMQEDEMPDYEHNAQRAIRALLDGHAPGISPDSAGPWADVVQALLDALHHDGITAVRRSFAALSRAYPALRQLVAAPTPAASAQEPDAPPLASSAHADDAPHAWLDGYVFYSKHWSPRSFDDFHENVGIWLLSAVAARRIVAHLGKPRHTPLLIGLVARSGLYAKTTAADVGMDVLRRAGLDYLVSSDSSTPQKFVLDRTRRVPDGYDRMPASARERVARQLAFAGQRGWWYDEFGMLVAGLARAGSTMHEFSGLLRRFDECEPVYRHGTVGRGHDEIINPYVALLAAMTPADLRSTMGRGAAGWSNGLWPRWAFSVPPDGGYRTDRFPAGERRPPDDLVRTLRAWHESLGEPLVSIERVDDTWQVEVTPPPATVITLAPNVVRAYYDYSDALLAIIAQQGSELDSWYARLHDRALRVAILLASIDGSERVELRHWGRSQAIAERWRASVHRLYRQVNAEQQATQQASAEDAVLEVIRRLGNPTVRDIKTRIAWLSRTEIQEICDRLAQIGTLAPVRTSHSVRYSLIVPNETEDEEVKN